MYYFLAHKLAKLPGKSRRQKRTIAENTFLLALDGDVDFQPNAVQLLVDRMRKNPNVGAACGRIHPIGSGNIPFLSLNNIPHRSMNRLVIFCCYKLKKVQWFGTNNSNML